jgi:YD repeat-containing protein
VRTYDLDGKITQVDSAGLKTYGYDDAFRITGITDTVAPANSWTYGYDLLDRITSGVKTGTTRGWSCDANGDPMTEAGAAESTKSTETFSSPRRGLDPGQCGVCVGR